MQPLPFPKTLKLTGESAWDWTSPNPRHSPPVGTGRRKPGADNDPPPDNLLVCRRGYAGVGAGVGGVVFRGYDMVKQNKER